MLSMSIILFRYKQFASKIYDAISIRLSMILRAIDKG